MRRAAVLLMAVLMPLSSVAVGASARPATPRVRVPALAPVATDALTDALAEGDLSEAEYALQRARSLSRLRAVREDFGAVLPADPHGATLILRDLALRLRSLTGEERDQAEALLARPTQGGHDDQTLEYTTAEATPIDLGHFRIHYVTSTADQATPAYATAIAGIMEEVYTKEVTEFDWKAPKSDQNATPNGGNDLFDVYLGNVGGDGIYGYCTTDRGQSSYDQHSYCVLDNDFQASEFGTVINGLNAARVTGAHEFAHAIQFAYDVSEDAWLLEATATWMEDEVYDTLNDNYQYLPSSSLGRPQTPADTWTDFSNPTDPDTGFQYGQFIWLRYLSEKFADRSVIRSIWEKGTTPQTGPSGLYSLQAIDAMLQTKGTNFASSFADFAARNAKASLFYEEGAAYETKVPPVRPTTNTLTSAALSAKGTVTDVDHLTSRYISFKPGSGVGSTEQITLAVNMGTRPGQKAMAVNLTGTTMNVQEIPLTNGAGQLTVPFGGQTEVVLVLVNASNRMNNCAAVGWSPGKYSCGGTPADDNQAYAYSGTVGLTATDPGDPGSGGSGDDTVAPQFSGVRVRPNPVAAGRTAKIQFFIDEAATLKLVILRSGRKVVSGTVDIPSDGGWEVPWRVPRRALAGIYTVKLTARDAAGNARTAKTSVKVTR